MSKAETVIIERGKTKIDLVALIDKVFPQSLIRIAPETQFGFSPTARQKGNAATITNIIEQIEKTGIGLSIEDLPKIAKALNILIHSGEIELVLARDRVLGGIAFLALKKVKE